MTAEEVLESLVEECHQDHVGLWEIVNAVHFDLGSKDPTETRALTLQLVRSLLDERGIQVGHPASDGRHFVSWNLPPDEAVGRIILCAADIEAWPTRKRRNFVTKWRRW